MLSSDTSTDDSNESLQIHSDDYNGRFKFPPPPSILTLDNIRYSSDSTPNKTTKRRPRPSRRRPIAQKQPPPMGFFWDIENCRVPKSKNAIDIAQMVRQQFLGEHREVEFIVVCDVTKEHPDVLKGLHDAQVNLVHVSSLSKNAADEKLRQSIRRFAEIYSTPATILLISSDINFAADLSDLRYRKKIYVILIHNANVSDALIRCANVNCDYGQLTANLPQKRIINEETVIIMVENLPKHTPNRVKNHLNYLINNCGGKILNFNSEEGKASIKFINRPSAERACKRMQGEEILGKQISVITPTFRNYQGKMRKNITDIPDFEQRILPPRMLHDLSNRHLNVSILPSRRVQENNTNSTPTTTTSDDNIQPIDLLITNFDRSLSLGRLKCLINELICDYVTIITLTFQILMDGTLIANLRVKNLEEAQLTISRLHRFKLGRKRLNISYSTNTQCDIDQLGAMVVALLENIPDKMMPAFALINLLNIKYHFNVSFSELNKLKKYCQIHKEGSGRFVKLNDDYNFITPPNLSKNLLPYCSIHCPNGLINEGWCAINLPNLMIELKIFGEKLKNLLDFHDGAMPLLSFQYCYEQINNEPLPIDPNGVPLEYLITCIPDYVIRTTSDTNSNVKMIYKKLDDNTTTKTTTTATTTTPPSKLAHTLNLFCHEIVDLLKMNERCEIQLEKFIPAYHHHFGRQCHVADYGYTKLYDLLKSIPHVVQILGERHTRIITLSHSAQIRRFTSDLLRVLKLQSGKQLELTKLPTAYEMVFQKKFNPINYGLCTIDDLLDQVSETIVCRTIIDGVGVVINIPKREQTIEECERTKRFANDVINMLKYFPYHTMLFNNFISAYHRHFGIQCKVSDYGFVKLIELFEAIPHVVKINNMANGERIITLTENISLKLLTDELINIINNTSKHSILLDNLYDIYLMEYGYCLKPETYDCADIYQLLDKIIDYIELIDTDQGRAIVCVDLEHSNEMRIRLWSLLYKSPHIKPYHILINEYRLRYHQTLESIDFNRLQRDVVRISFVAKKMFVALTDVYIRLARLYQLIYTSGGMMSWDLLKCIYNERYGELLDDFDQISDNFIFDYSMENKMIRLKRHLADYLVPIPSYIMKNVGDFKNLPPLVVTPCAGKRKAPPKPDTPCTPGNNLWNDTPSPSTTNLIIDLPIMENPSLLVDSNDVITPTKSMFPHYIWPEFAVSSPDPFVVPMPYKFINTDDDDDNAGISNGHGHGQGHSGGGGNSSDSGIHSKLETSDHEL